MPLFWLSLAFISGIILAAGLAQSTTTWLLLAAAFLLVILLRPLVSRLAYRVFRYTLPVPSFPYSIIPLIVLLGAARYQSVQPHLNPNFIAWYNDQDTEFILEGVLVEPPDVRDDFANLRLQTERIRSTGTLLFTPVRGLLLARVTPGENFHYGDRIRLQGQLETPSESEDFSYREYLARQGIYAYLSHPSANFIQPNQGSPLLAVVYALKERALSTVYRLYPDPEASLLAGILLGIEAGIPQDVLDAFKATGTTHIIAISGFNITILAALFSTIFSRLLGRWRGAVAAAVAIAIYTVLVGADAAVVRAAIIGGLSLFARRVGRRQDGLNSLAFVAALMALFNPQIPWDVGFQLSFAATLGLVLYADPLSQAFTRFASRWLPQSAAERLAGPAGEYFLFTLAAQLTTLPISIYHFRRLSLTSLIANPVILPIQPPVMILGGLAVILGLVYLPLGQLAAYLAWPFVVFTIRAVELLGDIPEGGLILGEVALYGILLFYALLFIWTFWTSRLRSPGSTYKDVRLSVPAVGAFTVLGILTVVVWSAALAAPDGRLHLTVLDVSAGSRTGDALLVQTPNGRHLLINGGPSTSRLSDSLGRRLPLFNRQLDYLVVAAPGEDQIDALPRLIERFPPANVLWAGPTHGTRSARYLQECLTAVGMRAIRAEAGQTLHLGEGARLTVLAVGSRGAVLLLEWGNFRALLPMGMDFETLEILQNDRNLGPVTALLLADGGFAPVNPPEWIEKLRPQVVLLSVAAGDWDGVPSPETLEAVQDYTLLRTDQNGWIHLSTDGEQMWVEVEK